MNKNIELKSIKDKDEKISVDTKEADKNKKRGDEEVKTSCITCKFKPNCHDAIPYYQLAADAYKGANKFNDEIYCRQKLIFCFINQKSLWEEGSEHQKIALIYLVHLKKYDLAIKSINNAYKCLFDNADYNDALASITDISNKFQDMNEMEHAESCLKIGFDCFKSVFHVIVTKRDGETMTLYNALYQYLNILVKNNKIKTAIESSESAIKTIEQFEQDKSKIIETYAHLLIFLILNNDLKGFENRLESARKHCEKNVDLRFLQDIESIPNDIENGQDHQFKNHTVEIKVRFSYEIYKKLLEFYNVNKKNSNVGTNNNSRQNNNGFDQHVVILNEDDKENEYL